MKPNILVAEDMLTISDALHIGASGKIGRYTPHQVSVLTLGERKILHLLALGHSNDRIAITLGLQCQTVRNTLTSIYQKLNLSDRNAAIIYYWGIYGINKYDSL